MEETIMIQGFSWHPTATTEQMTELLESMVRNDCSELIVLPNPSDSSIFIGVLLSKYHTPMLSNLYGVRGTTVEDGFHFLAVEKRCLRGFFSSLTRKMQMAALSKEPKAPSEDSPAELRLDEEDDGLLQKPRHAVPHNPLVDFLRYNTPAQIEQELNKRVIGQPELTKAVSDFLYYHALRQLHPELPQRPLLISGPSGSGKTEVWRVASKLYGSTFRIKIIDGSNLTCEGWAGNYKIDTFMDAAMVDGGILVVDEFDKLTKPKHSSSGDNVALDIQAEFLKLIEGEYIVTEKKKQTNLTSKKMGFVLVGAFESLRDQKEAKRSSTLHHIGFCTNRADTQCPEEACPKLTDEDFIAYGILPEVVGRISTKCATLPLSDRAYLDIIRGTYSRVSLLEQVLKEYGIDVSNVISNAEIREMVATSKSNRTGVRWVSAQVENRLLEAIREQGLFPEPRKRSA